MLDVQPGDIGWRQNLGIHRAIAGVAGSVRGGPVPGDLVVEHRRREKIRISVPAQIGGKDRQDPVDVDRDRLSRREAPQAQVLVPGQLGLASRDDVCVPVAVDVGREQRPGLVRRIGK